MNVLVTGGAGYIGSHTCKALAGAGHRPVTVDNLVYGHREAVKWGPFHEISLADTSALKRVIKEEKVEAVVHFAAYAYVGESVEDPLKYYENNVGGTVSLLTAMKSAGVKKMVFSSTCATYGIPEAVPILETSAQNPINPYGKTKWIIEGVLRDLSRSDRFSSVSLRYFNAAGADADLETGEDHEPETHLIPLAIEAAMGIRPALTVFGTDYPTPDGTCLRDYIHVTDLADAHVRALNSLASASGEARVYNLGTGRGYSVRDILEGVRRATGREVPVVYGERRPGDPPELVASPQAAFQDLGWKAQHSSLDNILKTAFAWHSRKKK